MQIAKGPVYSTLLHSIPLIGRQAPNCSGRGGEVANQTHCSSSIQWIKAFIYSIGNEQ